MPAMPSKKPKSAFGELIIAVQRGASRVIPLPRPEMALAVNQSRRPFVLQVGDEGQRAIRTHTRQVQLADIEVQRKLYGNLLGLSMSCDPSAIMCWISNFSFV